MSKIIHVGIAGFGMSAKTFHTPFLHQDPRFCIHKVFERQSDKAKSIYPYITTVRDFTQLLEITMPLIAQVLRENDWLACDEIAEKALALLGQPQFVEVKSKHYNSTKRILLRLWKKGLVERCYFHWRLKQVRLSE
ncbi:hypothetical protein [Pasteurella multocida]|uniref:hypothetical protein n=1 Tax=Pasteurella multocida TaxID=747 RepID=UPI0011183BB9|nr:hypothetical protein [Pasteurella multocida]MDY0632149.1 hypothetical protein [Pasteurella multocida]QDA12084.1 hypothetical protein E0L18_03865 [Pasteurella multocida subsp. multocida]